MDRRRATLWGIALAVTLAATGLEAATLRIPAGHDMFETPADGRSYFYLGASSGYPIPRGFFGCVETANGCLPSDPIVAPMRVNFKGLATGDFGLPASALDNDPCKWVSDSIKFGTHCASGIGSFTAVNPPPLHKNVDTIVLRNNDLSFAAVGSVATVPIELIGLSLQSIEPIEVRYGNGVATQRFHVKLAGPRVKGRTGTMTMKRSGEASGTYVSTLPVSVAVSFKNTSSTGPTVSAALDIDLEMKSDEIAWRYQR